jgi:N-acetylmuramoyl-L-alanine amidase
MTDPATATPPAILDAPLPYVARLPLRPLACVELVVIHCTELPDLATAREYGERVLYPDSGTGNSGHFYIDRDGAIHRWVPEDRVAHHVRGRNPHSVGIELVNAGRWPRWLDAAHQAMDEPYPDAQIAALVALLGQLRATLPALRGIAGHEDLDRERVPASDDPGVTVARKRDPGPLFPWDAVLAAVPLRRVDAPQASLRRPPL